MADIFFCSLKRRDMCFSFSLLDIRIAPRSLLCRRALVTAGQTIEVLVITTDDGLGRMSGALSYRLRTFI